MSTLKMGYIYLKLKKKHVRKLNGQIRVKINSVQVGFVSPSVNSGQVLVSGQTFTVLIGDVSSRKGHVVAYLLSLDIPLLPLLVPTIHSLLPVA